MAGAYIRVEALARDEAGVGAASWSWTNLEAIFELHPKICGKLGSDMIRFPCWKTTCIVEDGLEKKKTSGKESSFRAEERQSLDACLICRNGVKATNIPKVIMSSITCLRRQSMYLVVACYFSCLTCMRMIVCNTQRLSNSFIPSIVTHACLHPFSKYWPVVFQVLSQVVVMQHSTGNLIPLLMEIHNLSQEYRL